jgi:hypothetical protein
MRVYSAIHKSGDNAAASRRLDSGSWINVRHKWLDVCWMNADSLAEGAPERVCVVIWDGSVSEVELRRYLDDTLPLRFERWQDHTYLSTIEQLRPRVIVVVEPNDELAADAAGLLACLITAYTPTIIGMTFASETSDVAEELEDALHSLAQPSSPGARTRHTQPRLLVRQLGLSESARIDSMADLSMA